VFVLPLKEADPEDDLAKEDNDCEECDDDSDERDSSSSSSSSSDKKTKKSKRSKKSKKNKKKQRKSSSYKDKKRAAAKKAAEAKKEAEKKKKALAAQRMQEKLQSEREHKARQVKAAKNQQEATRVLAKVNPVCAQLYKALMDPQAANAATFAKDACQSSFDALTYIKEKADAIMRAPQSEDAPVWDREDIAAKCKAASFNLNTLLGMIKSAQKHFSM